MKAVANVDYLRLFLTYLVALHPKLNSSGDKKPSVLHGNRRSEYNGANIYFVV